MTVWKAIYGGYKHSPGRHDIMVAGSPATSILGMPLDKAHKLSKGTGVGFDVKVNTDQSYSVAIQLNLIHMSVNASDQWDGMDGVHKAYEQGSGFVYSYRIRINYSSDNGKTYKNEVLNILFEDPNGPFCLKADGLEWNLCYYGNWADTAVKGVWRGHFTLPSNATNISVSIVGKEAANMMPNYYSLPEIIDNYRPMAIRKENDWKSLDSSRGFLDIRKKKQWSSIPKMSYEETGKENRGTSRIRNKGKWLAQKKFGK